MSQRNKFHTAVHKLRSKTMIVGNISTERLQLNHILVPHGSKKMHLNDKIKGKGKIFYYYFEPYIKLRTENLPIVEQEI